MHRIFSCELTAWPLPALYFWNIQFWTQYFEVALAQDVRILQKQWTKHFTRVLINFKPGEHVKYEFPAHLHVPHQKLMVRSYHSIRVCCAHQTIFFTDKCRVGRGESDGGMCVSDGPGRRVGRRKASNPSTPGIAANICKNRSDGGVTRARCQKASQRPSGLS